MLDRRPSPTITPKMASKAKYLLKKKGLYQHQIAAILGVNQGRISEIKTGKLYPNVPPPDQLSFDFD